ncbi:MAG: hypothetical protein ACRYGA_02440 [Janthinobacterium lividum]
MKTIKATYDGPWWPYFKIITAKIIRDIHIRTVRLILALASVVLASLYVSYSVLYGIGWSETPLFGRNGYQLLRWIAPAGAWAAAFYAHAFGVLWVIYARRTPKLLPLVVNLWGFIVWAVMTLSLNFGLGNLTPGTSLEWVMVGFSGWALLHTRLGDDES